MYVVCMYLCMDGWMYVCMDVCIYVCIYVLMDGCMYECTYIYIYVCVCVCVCVCVYLCIYVFMCYDYFMMKDSWEKTSMRKFSKHIATSSKFSLVRSPPNTGHQGIERQKNGKIKKTHWIK